MSPQKPSHRKVQRKVLPERVAWATLRRGTPMAIKVLRGFAKTACPGDPETRKPEVAILDLTEERYAEFQRAPLAFVNEYRIFSCPVRSMEHLMRASERPAPSGDPCVTIVHEPDCAAYYY